MVRVERRATRHRGTPRRRRARIAPSCSCSHTQECFEAHAEDGGTADTQPKLSTFAQHDSPAATPRRRPRVRPGGPRRPPAEARGRERQRSRAGSSHRQPAPRPPLRGWASSSTHQPGVRRQETGHEHPQLRSACAITRLRGELSRAIHLVEFGDFERPSAARPRFVVHALVRASAICLLRLPQLPARGCPPALARRRGCRSRRRPGKYWEMHGLLFENQHALTVPHPGITRVARPRHGTASPT